MTKAHRKGIARLIWATRSVAKARRGWAKQSTAKASKCEAKHRKGKARHNHAKANNDEINGGDRVQELYEAVLAKAKNAVEKEKETNLSAGTEKLISTALKLYHATRKEREAARKDGELPPVITAE